jgi:hypothetical protein
VVLPPVIEEVDEFDAFEGEGSKAPLHRNIRAGLSEHQFGGVYIGLMSILADYPAVLVLVANVQRTRLMGMDAPGELPTRFGHLRPHEARGSA